MIRRLFSIILISALSLSCRMNNGDIGDLFGSWLLEDMTVDGVTPEDFDPEATFWSFQNNIIQISRVEFMYEQDYRWGTWTQDDNQLILNYTHHDGGEAPGTYPYNAPQWLGFPSNSLITLDFRSRSSRRMALSWQNAKGQTYVYSLRKIW